MKHTGGLLEESRGRGVFAGIRELALRPLGAMKLQSEGTKNL